MLNKLILVAGTVFETHAKKLYIAVGLVTLETWKSYTKVARFITAGYF